MPRAGALPAVCAVPSAKALTKSARGAAAADAAAADAAAAAAPAAAAAAPAAAAAAAAAAATHPLLRQAGPPRPRRGSNGAYPVTAVGPLRRRRDAAVHLVLVSVIGRSVRVDSPPAGDPPAAPATAAVTHGCGSPTSQSLSCSSASCPGVSPADAPTDRSELDEHVWGRRESAPCRKDRPGADLVLQKRPISGCLQP